MGADDLKGPLAGQTVLCFSPPCVPPLQSQPPNHFSPYAGETFNLLRADVSKYRPEAYKSEKLKNPKKIHRVALVELLSEIYFLFRCDDYY